MKIQIKSGFRGRETNETFWPAGSEQEVEEALGLDLITRGVAFQVSPPEPEPKIDEVYFAAMTVYGIMQFASDRGIEIPKSAKKRETILEFLLGQLAADPGPEEEAEA